jgi:Na+-transporting NADH:ubiquinone oxidoreductase subunit NqrD
LDSDSGVLRRRFWRALFFGLKVVWPILSILFGLIVTLGIVIGWREGWSIHDSLYFSFVTGLTIGYGDFAPKTIFTRTLAVLIGLCGMLFTALVAAIAVKALTVTMEINKTNK